MKKLLFLPLILLSFLTFGQEASTFPYHATPPAGSTIIGHNSTEGLFRTDQPINSAEVSRTFNTVLSFDQTFSYPSYTQVSNIVFTLASSGNLNGKYGFVRIIPDGTHTCTFPTGSRNIGAKTFDPSSTNTIYFQYRYNTLSYKIDNDQVVSTGGGTGGGGGGGTYTFFDDFTGSNTSDIAGRTPTTGGAWALVAGSGGGGVIGIVSAKAKLTSAIGTYIDYVAALSAGTTPIVECTVGTVGDGYDGFYPAWASNTNRLTVSLITGAVTQVLGGVATGGIGNLFAGSGTSVAGDVIKFDVATGNVYRNNIKLNTTAMTINSAVKGGYIGISFFSSTNTTDSIDKITAQ